MGIDLQDPGPQPRNHTYPETPGGRRTRASSHAPPQRAPFAFLRFATRRRKRGSRPWCIGPSLLAKPPNPLAQLPPCPPQDHPQPTPAPPWTQEALGGGKFPPCCLPDRVGDLWSAPPPPPPPPLLQPMRSSSVIPGNLQLVCMFYICAHCGERDAVLE
jgi:hypothetical protein